MTLAFIFQRANAMRFDLSLFFPALDAVGTRSCAIRRGMSKKRATAIFDLSLRVCQRDGSTDRRVGEREKRIGETACRRFGDQGKRIGARPWFPNRNRPRPRFFPVVVLLVRLISQLCSLSRRAVALVHQARRSARSYSQSGVAYAPKLGTQGVLATDYE